MNTKNEQEEQDYAWELLNKVDPHYDWNWFERDRFCEGVIAALHDQQEKMEQAQSFPGDPE